MKRYIILSFTLILGTNLSPLALSQTAPQTLPQTPAVKPVKAEKLEIMTAKVKGMVCDFCAQAVTKVFYKQDGVKDVRVDLDTAEIIVTMAADQSLDDDMIKKLIRQTGYSLVEIKRASI